MARLILDIGVLVDVERARLRLAKVIQPDDGVAIAAVTAATPLF